MPYNISKAVVNRSLHYLDAMLNNPRTINWPAVHPRSLAYKIREAMYAARRHKDFAKYHPLHDNFRIREYEGYVEAEYIGPPSVLATTTVPTNILIEEATDIAGAVGAVIKYGPRVLEIRFPNVRATEEELATIYRWGSEEIPVWRLINHEDNGITMTRRTDLDEILFWRPE